MATQHPGESAQAATPEVRPAVPPAASNGGGHPAPAPAPSTPPADPATPAASEDTATSSAAAPATEADAASAAPPSSSADKTPAAPAPSETAPPDNAPAASAVAVSHRRATLPSERPAGVPQDPWSAFALAQERAPGRVDRVLRVVGRALIHEYAVVTYLGLLLAVLLNWPILRYPAYTLPQSLGDPARQAWQIAWAGHALVTDPAKLWQANAYFPARDAFAYGDSLLGYAPIGMLGDGPIAATLRYNILFLLAHALLAIGGYALVRQLGAGRIGAAVAAVAIAYAPWRLAQDAHLDIVSAGGIPLALAMLARGHGWSLRYGFRPERGHAGWAAAGWLVAVWQISLGFSLGVPFAYVLAGIVLALLIAVPIRRLRTGKPVLSWPVILTDIAGAVIVAAVGVLIAIPYLKVADQQPSAKEIASSSAPLRGLLIAPAQSLIWGTPHAAARDSLTQPGQMTLLPGFALVVLALVGLLFSVWTRRQRLLLLAGLVVSVVLTLGTTVFGGRWTYIPLFGHLPGSMGVRVPGRLMLWVTMLLAVLAAGAAAEFARRAEQWSALRMPPFPGPWLRLATLVPLMLVLVEGLGTMPHPAVPARPAAMRTASGPMLVLPSSDDGDQLVQLWSTSRFPKVANGGGDVAVARQAQLRQQVASFPDAESIQHLRGLGITTVVLLRARAAGTPWERAGDIPVDALGIRREDVDDQTVVFRLN